MSDSAERRQLFALGMKHAADLAQMIANRAPGAVMSAPDLIAALIMAADCFSGDCLHRQGEEGHAYVRDPDLRRIVDDALRKASGQPSE